MQSHEALKEEGEVGELKLRNVYLALACFEDGGRGLQSKGVAGL